MAKASRVFTENAERNATVRVTNKSGIPGVYWREDHQKWAITITDAGKQIWLGERRDFFEACCVRKSAELRHGFHLHIGRAA